MSFIIIIILNLQIFTNISTNELKIIPKYWIPSVCFDFPITVFSLYVMQIVSEGKLQSTSSTY